METLAFLFSATGTVCVCVPPLLKGKRMGLILFLLSLGNTLVAISYFLTGAYNGGVSCAIGAVQTTINFFFERKEKPIPKWLIGIYAAAFIGINLLVYTQPADLIAILACLTFIGCVGQKTGKSYRLWAICNCVLWLTYDLVSHAYGPVFTHSFMLALTLLGAFLHDRENQT